MCADHRGQSASKLLHMSRFQGRSDVCLQVVSIGPITPPEEGLRPRSNRPSMIVHCTAHYLKARVHHLRACA